MVDPLVLRGAANAYRRKSDQPAFFGRLSILYLAQDVTSGEEVLLKTFREEIAEPGAIASFYAELDSLTRLAHPNILRILDYGVGIPGQNPHFIALPYCQGGNLRRSGTGAQFVPLVTASPLLRQVAAAIDHAHSQGVIHGDIKPENILLSNDRRTAFLADFGIARHFAVMERMATTAAPSERAVAGTSAYLSPEQLAQNRQSTKSDIYAFGLVAYELLTGRLPFDVAAPPFQQMLARVNGALVDPRDANPALPEEVSKALVQALHKDPGSRPATAMPFCNLLAPAKRWDLFIAYASADRSHADRLYDALSKRHRVFLDHRCLLPGDSWDAALAAAQRDALITVVLVSPNSGDAYYQREEVAAAVDMARKNPDSHRVVPVYLDGSAVDTAPYGLRIKHGLLCDQTTTLEMAAAQLSSLIDKLVAQPDRP